MWNRNRQPKKDAVINEMLQKTRENQKNKFELLKSPIVAEFLGFKNEDSYIESDLESAILTHIRDFLMEMGKSLIRMWDRLICMFGCMMN